MPVALFLARPLSKFFQAVKGKVALSESVGLSLQLETIHLLKWRILGWHILLPLPTHFLVNTETRTLCLLRQEPVARFYCRGLAEDRPESEDVQWGPRRKLWRPRVPHSSLPTELLPFLPPKESTSYPIPVMPRASIYSTPAQG